LVIYSFFIKVEFPTALLYVVPKKNLQKAWWQHHQTKMPMARMTAIKYIISLDSTCNLDELNATYSASGVK
jgi:hypothetical protein